jgi:hypothetical protein
MVQMNKQQAQMLPSFASMTRLRSQDIEVKTWAASGRITQEIPRVGFLSAINLYVRGTFNCGAGAAFTDLGPWNLLKQVRVVMNQGQAEIVRLSGYALAQIQALEEKGAASYKAGIGDTTPHTDLYQAPVASGDNTWRLAYRIPIALNQGKDFDVGLINLQAPELRCTIEIDCGANADVVTSLGTGFAGSIYISYEYYDVPKLGTSRMPPKVVTRWLEESIPILSAGANTIYTVPRQGIMLQLLEIVRANGARTDAIDYFEMKVGKTDSVDRVYRWQHRDKSHKQHSINFPVGVYCHDWWHAEQTSSSGNLRDAINTQKFTELDINTLLTSGTTLGSGNNEIIMARRIIQMYS